MICETCGAKIDTPVICVKVGEEFHHYNLETNERVPRTVTASARLKVQLKIGEENGG